MKQQSNSRLVQELTAQLKASEDRLRSLIERSPDAFVIVDRDGMVQFANQAAAMLFGTDRSLLIGRPFGLPVTAGETTDVDIVSRRGEDLVAEMRVVETEWSGKKAHVAVLRDITERYRAEQALRENEKRLTLAMEVAKLTSWDMDLASGQVIGGEKLVASLGYQPSQFQSDPEGWSRLVHPDDLSHAEQVFQDHLKKHIPTFRAELRLRSQSGEWRWILTQGEVVEWDEAAQPLRVIGVTEDVTERKEVEERIRQVSQHDPLTGLPNRTLLYEFVEHLLSRARRDGSGAAFLFVDLDRFKPVNDTYGHDVGDAVLKAVAKRLTGCIRGSDLVARIGGDEFIAVLSHISREDDVAKAARHTLESLRQPYLIEDGLELTVTPSIGIALFPQDGIHVDDLIKNADTAMYHAKESRKNDFQFFKQEFNERTHEALRIESRLRKGLEQREFVLFYQPVVDTETEEVIGAEALLRWPAMDSKPERFIPVAEKAGFMQSLGEWVVDEACRQQRMWHDKGLPAFPVAVNVSPVQFHQKHFTRSVSDALERSRLNPGDLRMEVTESTVMNAEEAADILHALRSMGVKVALDDFGTGYSSLSYLSRLPIDILKLDQSFVKDIGRNKASTAVAEGIIALGRSLGLEVIAEGVESEEALAFLRSQHCRRGQGFHFCHPMPAVEFERWYAGRAH